MSPKPRDAASARTCLLLWTKTSICHSTHIKFHEKPISFLLIGLKLQANYSKINSTLPCPPTPSTFSLDWNTRQRVKLYQHKHSLLFNWILRCVMERLFQDINALAGMWLNIYKTDQYPLFQEPFLSFKSCPRCNRLKTTKEEKPN